MVITPRIKCRLIFAQPALSRNILLGGSAKLGLGRYVAIAKSRAVAIDRADGLLQYYFTRKKADCCVFGFIQFTLIVLILRVTMLNCLHITP